jgi:hypothetical protein
MTHGLIRREGRTRKDVLVSAKTSHSFQLANGSEYAFFCHDILGGGHHDSVPV